MPRPGTSVVVSDLLPPAAAPTATDVAFFVGEAQRGPTEIPALVRSPENFRARFGDRIPQSRLSDDMDAYFGEGGSRAYVLRLSAGASASSVTEGGLTVKAVDPGAWGNDLTVELVAAGGLGIEIFTALETPHLDLAPEPKANGPKRRPRNSGEALPPIAGAQGNGNGDGPMAVAVSYKGDVVERALSLETAGELVAWATGSDYVRVEADDEAAPLSAGTFTLAGGADGTLPVTDPYALLETALRFDSALGPGQLQAPGKTTPPHHEALLKAAEQGSRVAFLDGSSDADLPTLIAHVAQLRTIFQQRFGGLWAQRAVIPGLAVGTTRLASWSAVQAGLQARVDAAGNPNQAAAGSFGICRYCTGLDRQFTDAEREALMYGGVNTAKIVYGRPRGYGFRSLVSENGEARAWLFLNNVRLAMAITARADAIAETYLFRPIDGAGLLFAALRGELGGMLGEYWPEGLYGETVADSYRVETGEAVNTPETIAAGEIRAVIGLRMAPPGEWVYIQIVKVPLTETV
jgi:phage tail sheath protein FI